MKRFKSRRKINNYILYVGLFFISILFGIKYLYYNDKINNIVDVLVNNNSKSKITDIDFLLKYALNINLEKEEAETIDEPAFYEEAKPLVYIYNTHQEEKYQSNYMNGYNISVGVLQASKILKEYLKEYNIEALVEEDSVTDKLHSLNWKYGYSYKVSRMFLESACNTTPSLEYFIDLHRDSSKYSETTVEINGEKYARLLFVIGLDNQNYEPNLELANKLKERIIAYNESLFRGIMKKSGKGVNGVYNQDFNSNVILIEVGGQYNSIEEVDNTLKILAKILSEYIEDDQNGKKEKN